jgi:hypothetical protein
VTTRAGSEAGQLVVVRRHATKAVTGESLEAAARRIVADCR